MSDAQMEARAIFSRLHVTFASTVHYDQCIDVIATALAAKDADLDGWKNTATEYAAELHVLRAQLAEKNKALEPFAKASGLDGNQRDNEPLSGYWADIDNEGPNAITFGHLRAARRAREAQGGE